jgi:ferredoxin/flavodoxin---NADP+ reductase
VVILEASQAGGQLTALFPEKPLYNVPAMVSSLAGDYARDLIQHARNDGVRLCEGEPVQHLEAGADGGITAVTQAGEYYGNMLIVATGMGRMEPRRAGVAGEMELAGKELVYAVTTPQDFAGKRVLVLGGGDSAVDNALLLSRVAGEVTLAHRSPAFKAQQRNLDELSVKGVRVLADTQTLRLERVEGGLLACLRDNASGQEQALPVDRVVVNVGLAPNLGPLATWGLKLERKLICVDSEMKTNLPGVFACGDAVTYPGKLKMVVTAVGEAATAVNSGYQYLKAGEAR